MIADSIKELLSHRRLMTVLIVVVVLAIGIASYLATTIRPSDLVIVTHYTAYGLTHFYRDSWVYLLSFIVFVFVVAFFAIGICLKLLRQERESLALWYGWMSVAFICLAFVTYLHIAGYS